MAYVPNASETAQPTEDKSVESAALEFRTLKVALAEVAAIAGSLTAVETVATNIGSVNAVAASILEVNAAAANMAAIIAAPDAALAASASAVEAAASAAVVNPALTVYKTSATGSTVAPVGTTAQRDPSPQYGYERTNSTLNTKEWWNGSAWVPMGGGATGAPGNNVFFENDITVTANYTVTSAKNAVSAGPITIADGVVVTIPTGSTWSIT